ncbi:MAG: hypothetical protein JNK72_21110 [Myxococcales bacterium]|nr:hypothetical protein [Myxococcales bacterium]
MRIDISVCDDAPNPALEHALRALAARLFRPHTARVEALSLRLTPFSRPDAARVWRCTLRVQGEAVGTLYLDGVGPMPHRVAEHLLEDTVSLVGKGAGAMGGAAAV